MKNRYQSTIKIPRGKAGDFLSFFPVQETLFQYHNQLIEQRRQQAEKNNAHHNPMRVIT